jgi:hypothetical protein
MHLWSIGRLKDAPRTGPLGARRALPYLLVWMVLTFAGTYGPAPRYVVSATEPAPWTTWDIVDLLGGVLLTVATVTLFYRANGGAGGPDLMARFIAINLVVSLGVAAVGLPIVFAASGWWFVLGPGPSPTDGRPPMRCSPWRPAAGSGRPSCGARSSTAATCAPTCLRRAGRSTEAPANFALERPAPCGRQGAAAQRGPWGSLQ